ncbi:MAG: nucleotidyltransferase domain-containing protein [Candidatus Solibacter usitatus]|nr:nucleotidyltransferase domain-containing protein [Candidatus Solibacter usitatus]
MANMAAVVQKIVDALRGDGQVEKVILFGAQAMGDGGADGDWDVMVVESGAVDRRKEGSRLKNKLSGVGVGIDLVVVSREKFDYWRERTGNVYYKAATEGRVVYEAA